MAYPNGLFSAFSFIGFLFCLIPLYWHLEAWNVGTTLFMAWAGLGCLNAFINSVVWNGTVSNMAPVWCDISTRFMIGLAVGLPASLLVINRRLYKIASKTAPISTVAEKRRAVCVDLVIGLLIPFLQMILEIIVEGHRFDIFEEIGCYPDIYNVTLAYPITIIWPTVISIITVVYCSLNICIFWKSSQMFSRMPGSNKSPNQNRYFRLIALSAAQISCSLPLSIFSIYSNAHYQTIYPWISWENTHFHYSFVGQFPSVLWRSSSVVQLMLELTRWNIVLSAFLFFAFFGFAEEARKHYRIAYSFANRSLHLPDLGRSKANSSPPYTPSSSFGHSFKKGLVTFGSRSTSETITERKDSLLTSEYRLTSDSSIFEGIDNPPNAFQDLPGEDDSQLVPASQSAVEVSGLPVPPPPIASVPPRIFPPHRLDSPLPHRPTSSNLYRDPSENV
ncbi:STE3-domain-containing protein [Russula ochroleuca]|uniref:STE3-domain-containing protein n=1 Tax=Russula ochroleuca TaxID=152965 RepID=A0A9P5TEE7_9AGAM|nr:STE3-domain-containing protein [Russula ochroleuca]